jgi:hypothetical protein
MMQFITKRYRVRSLKKVCKCIGKNGASLGRSDKTKVIAAKTVKNGVPKVNVTGRGEILDPYFHIRKEKDRQTG